MYWEDVKDYCVVGRNGPCWSIGIDKQEQYVLNLYNIQDQTNWKETTEIFRNANCFYLYRVTSLVFPKTMFETIDFLLIKPNYLDKKVVDNIITKIKIRSSQVPVKTVNISAGIDSIEIVKTWCEEHFKEYLANLGARSL